MTTTDLPAWINLDAVAPPETIAQRKALEERGNAILRLLANWVRDAAVLIEPAQIELDGDADGALADYMGLTPLEELVAKLDVLIGLLGYGAYSLAERLEQLDAYVEAYPELFARE